MSKAERLLSYSLLSLVTGKQLAMLHYDQEEEEDEDEFENEDPIEAARRRLRKGKCVVNSEGAWCWRERCERTYFNSLSSTTICNLTTLSDCLRLTKALVRTSETLQSVADLYDDHVSLDPAVTICDLKNMHQITTGPEDPVAHSRHAKDGGTPVANVHCASHHRLRRQGVKLTVLACYRHT